VSLFKKKSGPIEKSTDSVRNKAHSRLSSLPNHNVHQYVEEYLGRAWQCFDGFRRDSSRTELLEEMRTHLSVLSAAVDVMKERVETISRTT